MRVSRPRSRLRCVRVIVGAVLLTGLVVGGLPAAGTTVTIPADAPAVFDSLGLGYGTTVGVADVRRLADRLGLGVGRSVDPADVERVLRIARDRLEGGTAVIASGPVKTQPRAVDRPRDTDVTPTTDRAALTRLLDVYGMGYGAVVDDGDIRRLAARLGMGIGSTVDDADVQRLAAAARQRLAVRLPVFATARGVALRQPAADVELIGFHESNHDGARTLAPTDTLATFTPWRTLPSRRRGTPRRSAADIVTPRGTQIRAPVTGRVVRSGTYVLYCRYNDDYAVIEPDTRPGWEVKVLHIDGVRVGPGDRVVAGETVLADGPTPLPFRSQVNDYTRDPGTPHVHVEIIDPSIPDESSSGDSC